MSLTGLQDRKTPSDPIDLTFEPETGLVSDLQVLALVGHRGDAAASGSSGIANYEVVGMSNVADIPAASAEAETKFGAGSELAKMVIAAVRANVEGTGKAFPPIKCVPLAFSDDRFGAADVALTNLERTRAEIIVCPYDGE